MLLSPRAWRKFYTTSVSVFSRYLKNPTQNLSLLFQFNLNSFASRERPGSSNFSRIPLLLVYFHAYICITEAWMGIFVRGFSVIAYRSNAVFVSFSSWNGFFFFCRLSAISIDYSMLLRWDLENKGKLSSLEVWRPSLETKVNWVFYIMFLFP